MTMQSAATMQPVRGSALVQQRSEDLFEQFDRVYDSIARRAFELFKSNGQWLGHDLDDWLRAESELLHPVRLEMTESDSDLTILAEVPGFSAKDIEIKVEPRCLKIAGKREIKEEKNGRKLRSEWYADQILRAVELPVDVDATKASASLKDGILMVDLPKAPHAKPIRVEPKPA